MIRALNTFSNDPNINTNVGADWNFKQKYFLGRYQLFLDCIIDSQSLVIIENEVNVKLLIVDVCRLCEEEEVFEGGIYHLQFSATRCSLQCFIKMAQLEIRMCNIIPRQVQVHPVPCLWETCRQTGINKSGQVPVITVRDSIRNVNSRMYSKISNISVYC